MEVREDVASGMIYVDVGQAEGMKLLRATGGHDMQAVESSAVEMEAEVCMDGVAAWF